MLGKKKLFNFHTWVEPLAECYLTLTANELQVDGLEGDIEVDCVG